MCCRSFKIKPLRVGEAADINVTEMLVVFPVVLCKDL